MALYRLVFFYKTQAQAESVPNDAQSTKLSKLEYNFPSTETIEMFHTWDINSDGSENTPTAEDSGFPAPPFLAVTMTADHPNNSEGAESIILIKEEKDLTQHTIKQIIKFLEEAGEDFKPEGEDLSSLQKSSTGFNLFNFNGLFHLPIPDLFGFNVKPYVFGSVAVLAGVKAVDANNNVGRGIYSAVAILAAVNLKNTLADGKK